MKSGIGATILGCLLFIGIVLAAFVHNVTRDRGLTDEALREAGVFILPRPRALPEFSLTDIDGEAVTPDKFAGRWHFLYFGFTSCPDICPTSMAELRGGYETLIQQVGEGVDNDLGVMLVSVDPERDKGEALQTYVKYFHDDFNGATGSREELARFASAVNVAFAKVPGETPDTYLVDHSGNIVILNPRGHYHGFMKLPHSAATIADTFRTLRIRWNG